MKILLQNDEHSSRSETAGHSSGSLRPSAYFLLSRPAQLVLTGFSVATSMKSTGLGFLLVRRAWQELRKAPTHRTTYCGNTSDTFAHGTS